MSINRALLTIGAMLLLVGCRDEGSQQPLPEDVLVDISIVVTNIEYLPLQQDGGFVYLDGGRRGILLYRQNASSYLAFERNCTYRPTDSCASVHVHSSRLYMEDTCCGSQFDFTGRPTFGPAPLPLRRYSTTLSGNLLRIVN